jgi:hypothetical protein
MPPNGKPAKSAIQRPVPAARPDKPRGGTVAKPSERTMDAVLAETDVAFSDKERQFFSDGTPYDKKKDITLLSKYGYFKVFTYETRRTNTSSSSFTTSNRS